MTIFNTIGAPETFRSASSTTRLPGRIFQNVSNFVQCSNQTCQTTSGSHKSHEFGGDVPRQREAPRGRILLHGRTQIKTGRSNHSKQSG
ncbi:hypothetical protein TNCV_3186191 [Trichonephila clavipes]|nr:hypothetical protein TNCV_3186191 [Trichonephila clavipes]